MAAFVCNNIARNLRLVPLSFLRIIIELLVSAPPFSLDCPSLRSLVHVSKGTGTIVHMMVYHIIEHTDKLLPLPQPPVRAHTDARTNPSAQRATQLRRVLARVYAVSIQNQITTTVP
jgi:hypothetical protein